ncbi:pro-neuregulin-1, membrane-bound isoform-like [Cloeon dipterum]|uniref:pro-neuregulin-1, membrane-bound isoform-like n=1 Tax=Cloeon dipterum TaxID=197152 RepID=UPI0032206CD0
MQPPTSPMHADRWWCRGAPEPREPAPRQPGWPRPCRRWCCVLLAALTLTLPKCVLQCGVSVVFSQFYRFLARFSGRRRWRCLNGTDESPSPLERRPLRGSSYFSSPSLSSSTSSSCSSSSSSISRSTSAHRMRIIPLLTTTFVLVAPFLFGVADACSSRATPKPRSPSPTARPNVTFHTYACPPAYAAWYCLNGATCFTVRIGESLLYNCECADGYMGQRCEFKDLDGSYLPSRQKVMLEKASIAGGALVAILLVVVVIFSLFVHRASRRKALRAARYATNASNDVVDSRAVDVERRPFSHHRFPILDMSSVAQHHPPCTLQGVMPTEVHCTSPSRGATRPMQQLQQVSSVVVHQHSSSHIHPAHHHHHHLQKQPQQQQQQHMHHQLFQHHQPHGKT